uniref:Uncharacterized protein n=1 Tax=Medicago truncatula TaxID=3880 RepID=A2Q451_MEDTR|nr:hypothetical protein MtrDRAFT_AC155896g39v2 [Medicago truncatula]
MHLNRSAQNSHSYLGSYQKSIWNGDYSFIPVSVSVLFESRVLTIPKDPFYRLVDKGPS